jgi:phosphopantetheinyl transferase (holo-ACP synthase)
MSETFHRIYLSDQLSSIFIEGKKPFVAYLDESLFPEEREELNNLLNERRRVEFLGIRRLRNESKLPSPIFYTETRKPFLDVALNTFISISHSKNYCALGFGSAEIGIDIEEMSPRIERIASRFLNSDEMRFISEEKILDLTKLWTMKEAMFKLNNRTGIEFKSELIIEERSDDIYFGKMLGAKNWERVKLECFQQGELVISACSYL